MGLLNFRLTRVHSALLHGIAEVEGHAGFWPFRRLVRFRVGLNCDAIRVQDRRLVVWRAARPITAGSSCSSRATGTSASWMDAFGYRIVRENESAGNLQLHVFARAYRDAWLALHSQVPVGQHAFERLGVAIDFKEPGQPDGGTPG